MNVTNTCYQGEGDDPVIHLHGAIGRGKETLTGCVRKDTSVYLVIEAVITEMRRSLMPARS